MTRLLLTFVLFVFAGQGTVYAQDARRVLGGDIYVADDSVIEDLSGSRDVFLAGGVIAASGAVAGDLHAAGYDVSVTTETNGDLYAFGSSVTLGASVGQDTTAAGFSVYSRPEAVTAGNARLFGQTVRIEGPVQGALMAFGNNVFLDAAVAGDVLIASETVTFGPDARIDGQLTLASDEDISVPERVIPAERVQRETWDHGEMYQQMRQNWDRMDMPGPPDWLTIWTVFFVGLLFLVLFAAIILRFWADPVERMRLAVTARPFHAGLIGIFGLSIVFGLVPVAALTVVGIPFVPIALVVIFIVWNLGYLLAAYALVLAVLQAINGAQKQDPTLAVRLIAVVVGIPILALLNFIPVLGWVLNYSLVLVGVGAMTEALFVALSDRTQRTPQKTAEDK